MSKTEVFPYGLRLKKGAVVETFPAAEVQLLDVEGEVVNLYFLIDSGATFSALPKSDGELLGVKPEDGKEVEITGVSGEAIRGWRHSIKLRVGENNMEVPVLFLDLEISTRILGRKGFFDKNTVIFEESRKRSGITPKNSESAKKIGKIIDESISE